MYGKGNKNFRLTVYKRVISVIVAVVMLCANAPAGIFASAYTGTIGTYMPRVVFYYDDSTLDVQYATEINGSYTTISNDFTLTSGTTNLYFKVVNSVDVVALEDGILMTKNTDNIYTISNITTNTSITIGTVVNLDVSFGSIVIGTNDGGGGRKYTYSDSSGEKIGVHSAGNIYQITGTTGTTSGGSGNNIRLVGAGDFNIFLNDVNIHTGTPGAENIGEGVCAPLSTNEVTGNGNINITLIGDNTLENVSSSPVSSFAALEKNYTDSTLIINGDGKLTTVGGADSAGIGLSNNFKSDVDGKGAKNITINNGTIVSGTKGSEGAGIGSGDNRTAENIKIYGGNITATGSNNASGIGGSGSKGYIGALGEVYIYGGTIYATSNGSGAGIGGGGSGSTAGSKGGEGQVYIYGGNITACSIGGGSGGDEGGNATVEIYGGMITTITDTNKTGSIGGGNSTLGIGGTANITISGGTITAANISGGHGFGGSHAGGTLSITGGSAKVDHVCSALTNSGSILPNTVTVKDSTNNILRNESVTAITFDPNTFDYGITDMKTDNEGKLYLWLPSGTTVQSVNGHNVGSAIQSASISASASPIVVGTVLTANPTNISNPTYQWQHYTGSTWDNISGATNDTYTVSADDLGNQLLVIISGIYSPSVYVPAPPSFTVTIPASIPATATAGSFTIQGDRHYFESGQSLTVTCSGDFKLKLSDDNSAELNYTIYTNSQRTTSVSNGGTVATFTGSGTSTKTLYYSITDTPVYAGTYTGSLTFTVALNNGS